MGLIERVYTWCVHTHTQINTHTQHISNPLLDIDIMLQTLLDVMSRSFIDVYQLCKQNR
jgi:hypothetical protein